MQIWKNAKLKNAKLKNANLEKCKFGKLQIWKNRTLDIRKNIFWETVNW